jgi:hypothetical protein
MREVVVVAGSIAQRPGRGGHAWVFLQYLLGFRRLGYEVLFVDRLSAAMLEPGSTWPPPRTAPAVAWLHEVMSSHGLERSYSLLLDGGEEAVGVSRDQVAEQLRRSVVLLDVMGFLGDEELLAAPSRRVYLDIDPGFPQMWSALGLDDPFAGHDAYATVGLQIGMDDCRVPTCGVDWVTTPQPIVLDEWPVSDGGEAYTSVATWRGPFEPIDFHGERYGLRAHQMRRFADLPAALDVPLELALEIDAADAADSARLEAGGWRLVEPRTVADTPAGYRRYVQGSRGEVGVAKDMYVRSQGGWLSDRSLCYLASGKPVLAQATGFERVIETGEGLIAFASAEQASAGIEQFEGDYAGHCAAARELAEQRFGSDRVLSELLEAVA